MMQTKLLKAAISSFCAVLWIALTVCWGVHPALAQPLSPNDTEVGNSPQFDLEVFRTRADELFSDVVKGYSFAVVRNGILVGTASGGVAVDRADAPFPVPMDAATPANVGSTVKMASAVALLSFFENDPSVSVNEWLDRKIINYFPKLWRETLLASTDSRKRSVGQVTFRHLLQHKSGLAKANDFMRHGVDPARIGSVREYANYNLKILTFMLPYIVEPEFGTAVDDKAEREGITEAVENAFYRQELAPYFGRYMQRNFFDKVSIQTAPNIGLPLGLWKERLVPSCDHKTTYAGTPYFRNEVWGRSGDIPLSGDVDGDGKDDLVIWRPSVGQWFARPISGDVIVRELSWGREGDKPLVGDVNGDGRDDFIIWRPSDGQWFAMDARGSVIVRDLPWGQQGDIPFAGDINADGKADFVVWRPSTNQWFARNATGEVIVREVSWGQSGDIPLVGDINSNGTADFVIWRPSNGQWFAREANGAIIVSELGWGNQNDIPLVGDINGDGTDEFVIFRSSSGQWFARKGNGGNEILFREVRWGTNDVEGTGSIIPLVSDINGDGKDNLLIFRQTNGNWSAAGRRYALGYASKDDKGSGSPPESRLEPPGCYAQGGYWFAAPEYASWVSTFGFGDTFVSQAVRDMMFDPATSASRGNRLGWSNVLDVQTEDFPSVMTQFGTRYLPYHGGFDGAAKHTSAVIRLPNGYYAFGFANSRERDSTQIARGLLRAWLAAMGVSV